MKHILSILFVLVASSVALSDALIDPALKTFAGTIGASGTQRVLILTKTVTITQRPNRYDRPAVISYFKEATRQAVQPLLTSIQNKQLPGVKVLQVFWINGSILADVTREGLQSLAKHGVVTKIYKNGLIVYEPGLRRRFGAAPNDPNAPSNYHFTSIGLDRLNKEQPNINGTGVVVGEVDTGVDGNHPALAGKVVLFYNGQTKSTGPAKDFDEHGTHTSGTILGGNRNDPATANIGVAPGAKLIMAGALQGYDQMLAGMQFFLDQRSTPPGKDVKIIGCSWNTGGAPDQELFYKAIAAWEAAGILPVFSAGNAGRSGITPPHEYPGTFAIGAFGADGKIADFSSVGPGHYHGQNTQKPEIAAPGVDITSTLPGGSFGQMSGTSMAQPHVAGTAALLLQVKPDLNPAQMKAIIIKSATVPAGKTPGQWDPSNGFGNLNAYAAVKSAVSFVQMANSFMMNSLSMIIKTPEFLDYQEIQNASLGEVGFGVDQYGETDESLWMKSSEAFN